MGKKYILDTEVAEAVRLSERFTMLTLQLPPEAAAMTVAPGQFVEVRVPDSSTTYLRRPISICNYEPATRRMLLLIRRAGDGSEHLCDLRPGQRLNIVGPLGNGYTLPEPGAEVLLAGGGVGVAPMYAVGAALKAKGLTPRFLLGARTEAELLLLDEFRKLGEVHISTDDGSAGEKGYAADNSCMDRHYDLVCTCGPKPMMLGIARKAKATGSPCEVSLENLMACGLGACLCCVEPTLKGNLRACVEGPVFNTEMLLWEI